MTKRAVEDTSLAEPQDHGETSFYSLPEDVINVILTRCLPLDAWMMAKGVNRLFHKLCHAAAANLYCEEASIERDRGCDSRALRFSFHKFWWSLVRPLFFRGKCKLLNYLFHDFRFLGFDDGVSRATPTMTALLTDEQISVVNYGLDLGCLPEVTHHVWGRTGSFVNRPFVLFRTTDLEDVIFSSGTPMFSIGPENADSPVSGNVSRLA